MKTSTERLLTLLPWLSLPLVAAVHLLLWERTPERLAVQFDGSGNVTNSMTRGQSLAFELCVILFILVTSALKLRGRDEDERRSGLLILNATVLFVLLVFFGLLRYNIRGSLF